MGTQTNFSDWNVFMEVVYSQAALKKLFGKSPSVFAYPFGLETPTLRTQMEANFLMARGILGGNYDIPISGPKDWYHVPSHEGGTMCDGDPNGPCTLETYKDWINAAICDNAWVVITFHGIGGANTGYNPISTDMFTAVLDYIKSKQNDVWVAPFGEVGEYIRYQSRRGTYIKTNGEPQ